MSAGLAGRVNAAGLYLATVALFLIFVQVSLGRRLSWPKLSMRGVVRRWHFWVVVGIVAFVLGHIALNSGTVQMLRVRLSLTSFLTSLHMDIPMFIFLFDH